MKRFLVILCLLPLFSLANPEQKELFGKAYDVLKSNCFNCHGPEKKKGKLRLDTQAGIEKGGRSGEATVVIGHSDKSYLMELINLPVSDEDVMPPKKEKRLSLPDRLVLGQWIDAGAPWFAELTDNPEAKKAAPAVASAGAVAKAPSTSPSPSKPVAPAGATNADTEKETGSEEQKAFFNDHIKDIIELNCVSCHGPQKTKGGLRMDSKKAAMSGGNSGALYIPGKPDESELIYRIKLPRKDDEAMPPEEKRALSPEQIELMVKWVADGGYWPPKDTKLSRGGENHYTRFNETLSQANKDALLDLRQQGIFVEPLNWKDAGIRVLFTHIEVPLGDHQFAALKQLMHPIRWLDFSTLKVDEKAIDFMLSCSELEILHLEQTTIENEGIEKITALKKLQYLNLHSTEINDAGILLLKNNKALRKLYVWNSKVSKAGADKLKAELPELTIYGAK